VSWRTWRSWVLQGIFTHVARRPPRSRRCRLSRDMLVRGADFATLVHANAPEANWHAELALVPLAAEDEAGDAAFPPGRCGPRSPAPRAPRPAVRRRPPRPLPRQFRVSGASEFPEEPHHRGRFRTSERLPIAGEGRDGQQRPVVVHSPRYQSHERHGPPGLICREIGDWCNGSTSDSDSLSLGSNPRSPTQ
jgi:hypothetical protein